MKMFLAGAALAALNTGSAVAGTITTYTTVCYYESVTSGYVEEQRVYNSTSGYIQCPQSYRRGLHNFNLFDSYQYKRTTSTGGGGDDDV